jgi:thioredoxin-related protein
MQHTLIKTTDLQQDGQLSKQQGLPLMIMFSQEYCSFCIELTEEIINPMLISGDYTNQVIIREFMIDSGKDITDFNGERVDAREIFNRYSLYVTPSVLFVDSNGNELAERQIGINTVDYYAYYLDESIEQALGKLRGR